MQRCKLLAQRDKRNVKRKSTDWVCFWLPLCSSLPPAFYTLAHAVRSIKTERTHRIDRPARTMRPCNLLSQRIPTQSSSRLRHTLHDFRLKCPGSDQICGTIFYTENTRTFQLHCSGSLRSSRSQSPACRKWKGKQSEGKPNAHTTIVRRLSLIIRQCAPLCPRPLCSTLAEFRSLPRSLTAEIM